MQVILYKWCNNYALDGAEAKLRTLRADRTELKKKTKVPLWMDNFLISPFILNSVPLDFYYRTMAVSPRSPAESDPFNY